VPASTNASVRTGSSGIVTEAAGTSVLNLPRQNTVSTGLVQANVYT